MVQGCFCYVGENQALTIPAHGGIARPECVESCAVGISEGDRYPSKLVDPINRTSD